LHWRVPVFLDWVRRAGSGERMATTKDAATMSEPEARFYVELPADEDGNTSMPLAVVEGQYHSHGGPGLGHWTNPAYPVLIVTEAPPGFTYAGCYADAYGGFMETTGPARMLTRDEWEAITGWSRPR
jgi:hypothetical protein